MTDSNKIPITYKGTGETKLGDPAKSLMERKKGSPTESGPDSAKENNDPSENVQSDVKHSDLGSRAAQQEAEQSKAKVKANKKPHKDIESLEQFIEQAYSRPGQRISLKPKVEELLGKESKLTDDARARLLELAGRDWVLAVPNQLILVSRNIKRYPLLRNEIRAFVGAVLEAHPVYVTLGLAGVLSNLPDAPDLQQAMSLIAEGDLAEILKTSLADKPKPKQMEELRVNAINCLALWGFEMRGLPLEKVIQSLNAASWSVRAQSVKTDTDKLRHLLEIKEIIGVGLVCSAFKQMADVQAQAATVAEKVKNTALAQVEILQAKLAEFQTEIDSRDQAIGRLEQELESEKQAHSKTRTHLRDDYEQLRSRVLRRLKAEVSLLDEGLHALRREDPKLHVVEDHAERVMDGLKKEIKELESGG